jgi:isopentenyldiphosphate isomerase
MDYKELIKKLLPGIAPLILFVVADAVWGTKAGLIIAIAFGVIEVIIGWVKYKKTDKFILLDIGLLSILGIVSILLDNDLFFKFKPGIIGVIFCALMGFAAFGNKNFILSFSMRYMKNISYNPWQLYEFTQSVKDLFWVFIGHTVLVFLSAIFMSNKVWVLVSGPGFYIVFSVYFFVVIVRKRIKNKEYLQEEWLPIVNEKGKVEGKMPRSIAHNGSKILHPVVHLQVMNSKGEIYLQKRPAHKLVQPNKWDTAVGGHVGAGETIELSLQRESEEEIGLKNFVPISFKTYLWESEIEKELVFAFLVITEDKLFPNPEELSEGRYWSLKEIANQTGKGKFTPNFEFEYAFLKNFIEKGNLSCSGLKGKENKKSCEQER